MSIVADAANGRLPEWAEAGPARRRHEGRVASLMHDWARRLPLRNGEHTRWRAAGWLHDVLRDADAERLRRELSSEWRDAPDALLHGPAAAARLESAGVQDPELIHAIRYHSTGHPDFDRLGRALYLADFLEPGRSHRPGRLAALRARMPEGFERVLRDVVRGRICHRLDAEATVGPETILFWNSLLRERKPS